MNAALRQWRDRVPGRKVIVEHATNGVCLGRTWYVRLLQLEALPLSLETIGDSEDEVTAVSLARWDMWFGRYYDVSALALSWYRRSS